MSRSYKEGHGRCGCSDLSSVARARDAERLLIDLDQAAAEREYDEFPDWCDGNGCWYCQGYPSWEDYLNDINGLINNQRPVRTPLYGAFIDAWFKAIPL